MKILFATDTFFPSSNGTTTFLYHFAKKLIKAGHEVHILAPALSVYGETYKLDNGAWVHGVRSVGLPIYPDFRFTVPLNVKGQVKKHIKRIGPDVIHVQHHFVIGKATAQVGLETGVPVVGTNHFMPENLLHYFYVPKFLYKPASKIAWKQMTSVYEKLDFITTPTPIARDVLKSIGFKKEVEPISNGVDLSRFSPKIKGESLRKKYKLPNKRTILFVGRLDQEKKIEVLIKAFALAIDGLDLHLVIAGKGMEEKRLKSLVNRLKVQNDVTFTGFVPDAELPRLYRLVDVFAMSGDAELQSIATLEAMASGLPVIAARAVALPMLVKDGKNGYLFKAGDHKDLSRKIVKIFSNKLTLREMGVESLKMAKSHDVAETTEKFMNIYQALYSKRDKREEYTRSVVPLNFALTLSVVIGILILLSLTVAFNLPGDIKAEPRSVISKLNVDELAGQGVEKVKTGFNKLEKTLNE